MGARGIFFRGECGIIALCAARSADQQRLHDAAQRSGPGGMPGRPLVHEPEARPRATLEGGRTDSTPRWLADIQLSQRVPDFRISARKRGSPRKWCGWSESNRHSFRNRILSPARLPVPPHPHRTTEPSHGQLFAIADRGKSSLERIVFPLVLTASAPCAAPEYTTPWPARRLRYKHVFISILTHSRPRGTFADVVVLRALREAPELRGNPVRRSSRTPMLELPPQL